MTANICYPDSTDWSCVPAEVIAALPPELKTRSEALAWSTLQALTGYFFSTCPITVRPCRRSCLPGGLAWPVAPVYVNGNFQPHINSAGYWVNTCLCGQDACSCTRICEVVLPGPVGGPMEVKIDGAVLDPTAYRVDNGNRLVRQDGECWPDCQDMNLPADEVGTWSVTYYRGTGPNSLLDYAAGVLAFEFSKACSGQDCRLPAGVTSVSRQGVSFQIQTGLFQNGFTGIQEVDAIVGLYNPGHLKAPPYVTSPDARTGRVTTLGG
jgi:hypothetical protein